MMKAAFKTLALALVVLLTAAVPAGNIFASGSPEYEIAIHSIKSISVDKATVSIGITKGNIPKASSMGLVFSKTNQKPDISSGNTSVVYSSYLSGNIDVELTGLDESTLYYIRAFVKYGSNTAYSDVKQITTNYGYYIETRDVINIQGTSASIVCFAERNIESHLEYKGVVYSTNPNNTTIDKGQVVYAASAELEEYTIDIGGLEPKTKYYVKAFLNTDYGYTYGDMLDFTTKGSVELKLIYQDIRENVAVGEQVLEVIIGDTINASRIKLPDQYMLKDKDWGHVAITGETVEVLVTPEEKPILRDDGKGVFEPDKPITRGDVAKIIYALYGKRGDYSTNSFVDVSYNSGYMKEIAFAIELDVMSGYPDGTFKYYLPIKRSEICAVLHKLYKLEGDENNNYFTDTKDHWAKTYINIAYQNGILSGYPDNTFKPEETTTRAEAVYMFSRAEDRTLDPLSDKRYTDVPESHWAYKYIMNAAIPGY